MNVSSKPLLSKSAPSKLVASGFLKLNVLLMIPSPRSRKRNDDRLDAEHCGGNHRCLVLGRHRSANVASLWRRCGVAELHLRRRCKYSHKLGSRVSSFELTLQAEIFFHDPARRGETPCAAPFASRFASSARCQRAPTTAAARASSSRTSRGATPSPKRTARSTSGGGPPCVVHPLARRLVEQERSWIVVGRAAARRASSRRATAR